MAIAELIPDVANMRTHSEANLTAIRASLERWGQQKPIVIDSKRVVRCGNGTLEAAKKIGWTHLDCLVSELNGAELAAFAIADNRTAELAGWSEELTGVLASLRAELPDLEATDLGLTSLAPELPPPVGDEASVVVDDGQPDRGEDMRVKWGIERGQVWLLGKHRVMCGDSTSEVDVKRLLNGCEPLFMVTDPPYGVDYEPGWRDDVFGGNPGGRTTRKVEADERSDWTQEWKLFHGDIAYVWHAGLDCGVVQKSLLDAGFLVRAQIIWAKSHFAVGLGHYHWQHEPCFYAVRNGKPSLWRVGHDQTTVWNIEKAQKNESGHSTQKPLDCMFIPIRNHDSEYVYDPFLGSGTTVLAAEQLDRVAFGMDIDPCAVAIALDRWVSVTSIQPVKAS